MSLFTAAAIVSVGIAVCSLLPHFFSGIRRYTRAMLFTGTAVLLGFVFFDLIPEMMEIGGAASLVIMALSWGAFAGIHALSSSSHNGAHGDAEHGHQHAHTLSFLLGSMALHGLANGMLLVSSYAISEKLATAVFLSLIGHKAFEAIAVSSLILEQARSTRHLYTSVAIYALAFPVGVLLTAAAQHATAGQVDTQTIEQVAMVLTSVAVGSLFGCLLQDFLLPSVRELRQLNFRPVRQAS